MAAADGGAARLEIRSDRLLLVEGQDEVNLFDAFLKHCFGAVGSEDIQIIPAGGKHSFRKNLTAITAAARARPTLRAVGAVRDADNDATSAFQSVCDALRHVGYEPPAAHGEVSSGGPAVGVSSCLTVRKRGRSRPCAGVRSPEATQAGAPKPISRA